jgi:CHASE2 domain-containing sensor protein
MNKNDIRTNLLIGSLIVVICIYLSFMSFPFFESLEKVIYEIEMRLDTPRNPGESKVAIVNIDDKSINELGKWPWPRHIIAEMIKILKSNGAKLIGIEMVFSEKEQNLGIKEIKKLYSKILNREKVYTTGEKHTWILAELEEIEKRLDNDKVLSQTLSKN